MVAERAGERRDRRFALRLRRHARVRRGQQGAEQPQQGLSATADQMGGTTHGLVDEAGDGLGGQAGLAEQIAGLQQRLGHLPMWHEAGCGSAADSRDARSGIVVVYSRSADVHMTVCSQAVRPAPVFYWPSSRIPS